MSAASRRWPALGVLCVSLLVIVIDNTIVNVALPTLVRDLKADVAELQWVVDAYTLVFAAAERVSERVTQHRRHRRGRPVIVGPVAGVCSGM